MNEKIGENPLISVIMGVYNCEETIRDSIECIINQTYKNWEFIICDDGSTDATYSILLEYEKKDPRFIVLRNEGNKGLNYTLNKCLARTQGVLVARMDGDDRCSPERFEVQIKVLKEEEGLAFVSSNVDFYSGDEIWGTTNHMEYPDNKEFLRRSPFSHAACMIKKSAFEQVGGYTESKKLLRVEDYHLWLKLYKEGYKGKNIKLSLYQAQDDMKSYHRRKFKYSINQVYVRWLAVKYLKLPLYGYLLALKPLIVALLPRKLYLHLHRKKRHK